MMMDDGLRVLDVAVCGGLLPSVVLSCVCVCVCECDKEVVNRVVGSGMQVLCVRENERTKKTRRKKGKNERLKGWGCGGRERELLSRVKSCGCAGGGADCTEQTDTTTEATIWIKHCVA